MASDSYCLVGTRCPSNPLDISHATKQDCHNLSIKTSYDVDRLMNYCRVINGEICYYQKEVYNLYDMFHTRYSMFKRIYTHRVGWSQDLLSIALYRLFFFLQSIECQCHLYARVGKA